MAVSNELSLTSHGTKLPTQRVFDGYSSTYHHSRASTAVPIYEICTTHPSSKFRFLSSSGLRYICTSVSR